MDEPHASDPARFALVTGTSRGVGEAVAMALLARGWTVTGLSRSPAALANSGYRHLTIDLADVATLENRLEREMAAVVADARWTRLALVNNAAASGVLGPIETVQPRDLVNVAAVNWAAPTWLIGFMLRHAPVGAALRIVNVSSGAAVRAFPGLVDYCSTKAALRMAAMVAAAELDSDLRRTPAPRGTAILSYEPGTVDTAMQHAARTRPLEEYPWGGLFRDFAARGALVPPEAPAAEIVAFVEADGHPRFSEARFGR